MIPANRCCITAFLLILLHSASAQDKTLPDELIPFIIKDHEVLDLATGDLNGDKKPDAILILKRVGEDSLLEEDHVRPLLLLVRQENGQLKQMLRNDSAIMCRRCGGIFGDPYQQTDIHDNGLSLYFYGGSSWRWATQYDFTWRPALNTWLLARESKGSFNAGDPEMTMKETLFKEAELGEISISRFRYEAPYEDSRWKVNAAKTFFYESPQLGSKPGKGYLVKGNTVTGIRHLKNFIEVSYDNGKAVITQGYILRKDLLRLR
jgi:hypothetical protein